jgi:hypothetical protein
MPFGVRLLWHVLCSLEVVTRTTGRVGAFREEKVAMRVLVADDDAITRKFLQASLTRCGYEVTLSRA